MITSSLRGEIRHTTNKCPKGKEYRENRGRKSTKIPQKNSEIGKKNTSSIQIGSTFDERRLL